MKRMFWMVLLAIGVSGSVLAENDITIKLECRDDDPYVFCTQGCKGQHKNWVPTNPGTTAWMAVGNYCPWPSTGPCCIGNYCWTPWTQTAFTEWIKFMNICGVDRHHGGNASDWVPENGQGNPEDEPVSH